MPETEPLELATETYFRKFLEKVKELVTEDTYQKIMRVARAFAGGKAPRQAEPQGGDPADPSASPSTGSGQGSGQALETEPEAEAEVKVDEEPSLELELGVIGGRPTVWALEQAPSPDDAPAMIVNERGWVRKVILRTGEWVVPPPGGAEPLQLTLGHLQMIKDAFDQGAFERVSVPVGHGNAIDDTAWVTEHNTGYVRALEIEPHTTIPGEWQLASWIQFTDKAIEAKIKEGSIWNVSVLVLPGVERPRDGKLFPLALKHLALTNYPWMDGLGGFSLDGRASGLASIPPEALVLTYRHNNHKPQNGGDPMTTELTNHNHATEPTNSNPALVLSQERLDALLALEAKQAEIQAREQAIAAREAELAAERKRARVQSVIMALEGKGQAEGVTLIAGYRHCPAVVREVETILGALPAQPATLRLSLDGGEKDLCVEDVVLRLVNALPEAARIKEESAPRVTPQPQPDPAPAKRGPESQEEATLALSQLGIA